MSEFEYIRGQVLGDIVDYIWHRVVVLAREAGMTTLCLGRPYPPSGTKNSSSAVESRHANNLATKTVIIILLTFSLNPVNSSKEMIACYSLPE